MTASRPSVRASSSFAGRRLVAASLVGAVLFAACGSDDEADSTDTTVEPLTADDIGDTNERDGEEQVESAETTTTTTTVVALGGGADSDSGEPAATTTTTEPGGAGGAVATTTTEATTTTTEPPPPEDESECLVGQWRLRDQPFIDELASTVPPGAVPGGTVDWTYVSGDYFVDINADGTTRSQRLAWSNRLASPEGAIITTIDSDDSGTWSVDGSTISIADEASSATVSIGLEVGGTVQPIPTGTQTFGTEALSGSGTFDCDGTVLSITLTDLPGAPADGITATLDRR